MYVLEEEKDKGTQINSLNLMPVLLEELKHIKRL